MTLASARLEGRNTDFDEETYDLDIFTGEDTPIEVPVDVDFDQFNVFGGISYHF